MSQNNHPDRQRQTLSVFRRRATLRRSFGLLSDFKYEQTRPDIFYGHLAEDTVGLIRDIYAGVRGAGQGSGQDSRQEPDQAEPLHGTKILDVGGGPGYFGVAFDKAGADYYTCEPDVGEMAAAGIKLQTSTYPFLVTPSTSPTLPMSPSTYLIRGGWPTRCCG